MKLNNNMNLAVLQKDKILGLPLHHFMSYSVELVWTHWIWNNRGRNGEIIITVADHNYRNRCSKPNLLYSFCLSCLCLSRSLLPSPTPPLPIPVCLSVSLSLSFSLWSVKRTISHIIKTTETYRAMGSSDPSILKLRDKQLKRQVVTVNCKWRSICLNTYLHWLWQWITSDNCLKYLLSTSLLSCISIRT